VNCRLFYFTNYSISFTSYFVEVAFSALMLLVVRQEGHIRPVKTEWWDVGVVVLDEVQTCI